MTRACWTKFRNFRPEEFKCGCGKCNASIEYVDMDCSLIFILQAVRDKYGKSVNITSGFRCYTYNKSLPGAVTNSRHLSGKAADFNISGGKTKTVAGREEVIAFMKTLPNFRYAYHNVNGNHPNMGNSIHVEVL